MFLSLKINSMQLYTVSSLLTVWKNTASPETSQFSVEKNNRKLSICFSFPKGS